MNLLDKIRSFQGNDSLISRFESIYNENVEEAAKLINDPELSFTSLYILIPVIDKLNPDLSMLSERNKQALSISSKIARHEKLSYDHIDFPVAKWMFFTGYMDDGMSNEFDNILDITASVLVISFKEKSILPILSDIIFKRHRLSTFNLYLIWVFFESRDPDSLLLTANKILSPDQRDFDLALELLNFIPMDEFFGNLGNPEIPSNPDMKYKTQLFEYFSAWIHNNREKLFFTGESYQFSSVPAFFRLEGDLPSVESVAYVRGVSVDFDSLMNEFPRNSLEKSILESIRSSSTRYNYDSLDQLRFEVRLRKEIVNASYELYRSGMAFEIFREARSNPNYWITTREGGFLLRDDVKPSDAIRDIFKNGRRYGTECATAMVIIYYKALLNIFPEELFNQVFRRIHLMDWHYIDRNLREIGFMRSANDFIPGDRRYVINPDVNPETPEWQGENIIDLGNGRYYGHGIGIGELDWFVDQLNRNRKKNADESAYLMLEASRPNFKRLADIYYKYLNEN